MIDAMMLFGSAARGDAHDESDVDLLAIYEASNPYSLKKASLELQFMPFKELLKLAAEGDLFAIHLALEGKIIFDNKGIFKEFREKLHIKRDYKHTINQASSLGWFLLEHGYKSRNKIVLRKRITWCVRTILIARLVEKGRFIFSPNGIIGAFNDEAVTYLISNRKNKTVGKQTKFYFKKVIENYSNQKSQEFSRLEYLNYFEFKANNIAISTYKKLFDKEEESILSDDFYI